MRTLRETDRTRRGGLRGVQTARGLGQRARTYTSVVPILAWRIAAWLWWSGNWAGVFEGAVRDGRDSMSHRNQVSGMRLVCAWCLAVLSGSPDESSTVTHGICQACFARELNKLTPEAQREEGTAWTSRC